MPTRFTALVHRWPCVVAIAWLVIGWLMVAPALADEPACDLRVRLTDPKGKPVNARVFAVGLDGVTIAEAMSENGVAELCDIGFKRFDLKVQNSYCGMVILPDLRIAGFPSEEEVTVVLNPCAAHQSFYNGCVVLLRVQGPGGKSVEGATFVYGEFEYPKKTDSYGRIQLSLLYGMTIKGEVRAAGFKPAAVRLECRKEEPPKFERTVTLELADKQ